MSRSKLIQEIKECIQSISKKELETNFDLYPHLTKLGKAAKEALPQNKQSRINLPEFLSIDLLLAKGKM